MPPFIFKHYLVTGGCGFIGSHLADALIREGHAVTILDNLSTGKRENAPAQARLIVGDTTHYPTVQQAMEGVDGCFHLAAIASVEKSISAWTETHSVNITSTVNLFQAASRQPRKIPVVYTSSAAVYGEGDEAPVREDHLAWPLTAYGADKLACDMHARVAWQIHRVPVMGMRPFNVYGPRQDPHSPYSGVISIFAERIRRRLPIMIHGDGLQMRDFVYVGDAVKAFMAAMRHLREGFDVVNICTGRATPINQLAQTLEEVVGWHVPQQHIAPRKGDIRVSVGDPSRLALRLNVRLNTSLKEGLQQLVGHRLREAA